MHTTKRHWRQKSLTHPSDQLQEGLRPLLAIEVSRKATEWELSYRSWRGRDVNGARAGIHSPTHPQGEMHLQVLSASHPTSLGFNSNL